MRNILITVMLLLVVVVLFIGVINNPGGIRTSIANKGGEANQLIQSITNLSTP